MNIFSKIIKTTTDLLRGRTGSVKEIADFLGSQNYASAEINNYTCEEISKILSQIDVAANSFSYLPTEFQADILVHNELPYGPSYKPQDTIDHVVYLRTQQAQQLLLILKKQERTDISRINMIKQKIKQAKASMVGFSPLYGQVYNFNIGSWAPCGVIDQFFVGSINEWLAFKKDIHPLFQEQESIKSFTSDDDGQVVTEIYDEKVEIYCRAIFKNLSNKKDNVEIILEADYLKGNKSLKSESVRLANESLDGLHHQTLVFLRDVIHPKSLNKIKPR